MSVPATYTAALPVGEETVQFVSALLATKRRRREREVGAGLVLAGSAALAR